VIIEEHRGEHPGVQDGAYPSASPAARDKSSSDTPGDPVIRVMGLTKRFGGVTAIDGVDFDLLPGEVHALVGENGAGKSTLMKIVHGLYAPDEGQLEVEGRQVTFVSSRDAEAAGVAMIPQELDLFPELSVAENLYVGRHRPRSWWGGLDWTAMRTEARRQFETLGIDIDVTLPARLLSTANRQIVLIARALMGDARAVIMDEPTSSLTEREVQRLFEVIKDLTERGVGVVYVSHRLDEVFTIADRISVLRDGLHIKTAPVSELDSEELVRLMVGRALSELFVRNPHQHGSIALELKGLSRSSEFTDIDLTIHRGEVVGLAGLIGAGRTELAQAVFGIRPVESGEIYIDGERVSFHSPQEAMNRGVVYVPEERQSQGLILPFPIYANITLSILQKIARAGFLNYDRERKTTDRFADALSIRGADVSEPISRLSGGNQQKAMIAKSLACEPSILLLDEPTRGVDVGAKSEIYRLIDQLGQDGKAILLISSELEEVLSMADRVVVMREGRITAEFDRDEATQERVMAAAAGVEEKAGAAEL